MVTRTFSDSLYVFDYELNRVSVFDQSTGAFTRSQSVDVEGWRADRLLGVTSDGILMKYTSIQGMSPDGEDDAFDEIRLIPLADQDPSDAVTIWRPRGHE